MGPYLYLVGAHPLGPKISSSTKKNIIYINIHLPNDPCFDWKRPSFGGFNPQNKGQTWFFARASDGLPCMWPTFAGAMVKRKKRGASTLRVFSGVVEWYILQPCTALENWKDKRVPGTKIHVLFRCGAKSFQVWTMPAFSNLRWIHRLTRFSLGNLRWTGIPLTHPCWLTERDELSEPQKKKNWKCEPSLK